MGRGFDPQFAGELTEQWVREGFLARGQMKAEDVAKERGMPGLPDADRGTGTVTATARPEPSTAT